MGGQVDKRRTKSLETISIMTMEDEPNFSLVEPWENKRPGDNCKSKGAKKRKMECCDRVCGEQVDH